MIAAAKINYLQGRIARNDDQQAYRELFVIFYNPLLHFARSFLSSKEQAEEAVSDVFIHIWEKRRRLETVSNLKVYLYIATKNTALNYRSRQNKHRTEDLGEMATELKSIYFNPEQLLITAEMIQRIRQAINQLPTRCRLIFKLVKEDELKYREVAEILQLSVKTVEAQMTIALRKIGTVVNFDIQKTVSTRPCSSQ
ncbi:MAG: RNA polymerase sigma-70 factor [Sediminibacterium magnilacihabitans]|jgi:RNA polymerase sigma-70 factor (family 1)|nr:RNA polymerase sigma-70 factor [Sediminibacterium magnilacihabitans]PQV61653.1 RNA polymerase sigma-70 factor (ECF subfamily) [Sediminibacterium magnilacihabitans]